MIREIRGIYFSPSGGTKEVVTNIAKNISAEMDEMCISDIELEFVDTIKTPLEDNNEYGEDSIVVFGVPVFAGRVPMPCVTQIRKLKANNTMAIAVVSFGNSTYGDALYELYSLLEKQGFKVVSAAAFISNHSMFKKVAIGRPDDDDLNLMKKYSKLCANKLKRFATTDIDGLKTKLAPLKITGSMPTKEPMKMPIRPSVGKGCLNCGTCISVCPMGAICKDDPAKVDTSKCISCTACISACPNNVRGFYGPISAASGLAFEKICGRRKEPEWFI